MPNKSAKSKSAAKSTAAPLAIDPDFAKLAKAFAEDPTVTCGKMMASVGLKVNGKIFAMMTRGNLVIKLPKDQVAKLVTAAVGTYFDPRNDGRVLKEWISIADRKAPWLELARHAYHFVKSAGASTKK